MRGGGGQIIGDKSPKHFFLTPSLTEMIETFKVIFFI